jgi:hypothetical protein
MINLLFKSLVNFQGCFTQQLIQEEKNVEVAKQSLIFKLSSIKKRIIKSLIIKFTNLIKYQQMIMKTKHVVSLVKFHQSLPKILEYQNLISLLFSVMEKKEKLKVIIKYLREKLKSQNLIVKYNS